ncbi:MAG TPA: alpha-2-macroglobulin family protein, partial [Puia sp.]|nr:alpha-2-macroglobulin family protein [Puia sp.]
MAFPEYHWQAQKNNPVEPGEKSTISIGSSANDLFVIQQIEKKDSATYSFVTLSNEKKSFDFWASENDRGGYGVSFAFVKDNRFYSQSNRIEIPWTNKDLKISYETYRDKTLPGNKEKWKIRISGVKKEKIAAEVLSSMYDASLDQFQPHDWSVADLFNSYSPSGIWRGESNFSSVQVEGIQNIELFPHSLNKQFDDIISISQIGGIGYRTSEFKEFKYRADPGAAMAFSFRGNQAILGSKAELAKFTQPKIVKDEIVNQEKVKEEERNAVSKVGNFQNSLRKNFNETAFFFPDLLTDASGGIEFSFTMPEALTSWKWMNLAHTQALEFGYSEKTIITQKQLMVQPNAPRFLREGDRIDFSAKIINLTDSEITGQTELQLIDPATDQPVDGWFQNIQANQYFTAGAGQSVEAVFPLSVPFQFNKPVLYRVFVRATASGGKVDGGSLTDGEEAVLPVVSNRILITETLPLNIQGTGTKKFGFEKLLRSGESPTLNHHQLTVEFTSNPAWYAVEALPYLMEFPHECAEQIFNRFYANALASEIANSSPSLRKIFEHWKISDSSAVLSNLQKNQELKTVLLEETPWVLLAKNEAQEKNNIALLFDLARMRGELESSLGKLKDMQSSDGGFAWFKDGPDDRFITQYILTGIGHLKKLNALPPSMKENINALVSSALTYL